MSFSLHDVTVRHHPALVRQPASQDARAALGGVTLSARQGEQIALIGPSGAGKTTLLHTLACALTPSSGSFTLLETAPWKMRHAERHALRRRLFLAPQTPPLPPRQRVVTAVLAGQLPRWNLARALWSLLKPLHPERAFEALSRFHLGDKLYMRVDRLSGGERQRCSLARLLVSDAEVLLVDEPLSALDPALSRQTLSVLQQEASARNATMVCSLHQVDLALDCFPRIVGLREGRIVFDAPREAITDAMIAELYRHAGEVFPASDLPGMPGMQDIPTAEKPPLAARCF
jgi:phosphonate transport system ATP-binding protein